MRAIVLRETGAPENLRVEEVPVPAAGPGQILIRTEAIAVSFTESAMRSGALPLPVELPATFGFEAAGIVAETGEGVDQGLRGRRVAVMDIGLGCYAEYAAVPASAAAVVPDGLSAEHAVAVATFGAVALCLVRAANLTGQETVLVEVAAGGVGGYLTQLARSHGAAKVVGTAGSQVKRDHAMALGADEVLDHTSPGWWEGLAGIDVVFDSLAGDTPGKLLGSLTPGTGRVLLYGVLQGPPTAPLTDLLSRGLSLAGCGGPVWMEGVLAARTEVMRMAADGDLRPMIDSVLPLEDAAAAHERFEQRTAMGKIILRP